MRDGDKNPLGLSESLVLRRIAEEIEKFGVSARREGRWFDVMDENIGVQVKAHRSTGYYCRATGKWQVTVGGFADAQRFYACKKDFDYAAIAAAIIEHVRKDKASRENTKRIEKERAAFKNTVEYKILDILGVNLRHCHDCKGAEILRLLSPAALDELAGLCNVNRK